MRYYYTKKGLIPIVKTDHELFTEYYRGIDPLAEGEVKNSNMSMVRWLLKNDRVLFLHWSEVWNDQGMESHTLALDTAALFAKKVMCVKKAGLIVYHFGFTEDSNHEQDIHMRFLVMNDAAFDGTLRKLLIDEFLADNP